MSLTCPYLSICPASGRTEIDLEQRLLSKEWKRLGTPPAPGVSRSTAQLQTAASGGGGGGGGGGGVGRGGVGLPRKPVERRSLWYVHI